MFRWLELKVPPIIVLIVAAVQIYLLDGLIHIPVLNDKKITTYTALFFSLMSCLVILWALLIFKKQKTTLNPLNPESTQKLISSGIFNYSRNPIYLGMSLLLVAQVIWQNNLIGVFGVVFFIVYLSQFQIMVEEKILKKTFGKEFEEYSLRVRRWI